MTSTRSVRLARMAIAGAFALVVAACGGDDEGATATTAASAGATEDTTATTAAPAETTTTAAAALEDPTAEVTAAYTAFFDNFAGDLALLEDGDTFSEEAIQPMRDSAAAAGRIAVNVRTVTALDDAGCEAVGETPPCAEVLFDLAVAEDPAALPDQTGFAVFQDGAWKVAKSTFCSLAQLGSGLPEGC